MAKRSIDKPFLTVVLILIIIGFFGFSSAALGLLARGNIAVSAVMLNQLIGLAIGVVVFLVTLRINYRLWNKYAFYLLMGALLLTLAVFIPGLGFTHAGATRWLSIGTFSFQPAELLKVAFVLYLAAWFAGVKQNIKTFSHGVLPLILLIAVCGGALVLQPDLGTLLVIGITGVAMFIIGGGKWTHLLLLFLIGVIGMGILSLSFPYVQARLLTFIDPSSDALDTSYQIQQSLIAIGSGQLFGRGFGQSVQKFNFLPEPVGDSIFAVFAEEWGFVGTVILIILFTALVLRGLKIATKAPSIFSMLTVSGLVLLIVIQSFANIAAMLGIFPLTGMPLLFVSQGGSALMTTLGSVGIILNISGHIKQ